MHDVKKSDVKIDLSAEQQRINKEKIVRFNSLYKTCFTARDDTLAALLPKLLRLQTNSQQATTNQKEKQQRTAEKNGKTVNKDEHSILWIAPKAAAGFVSEFQHLLPFVTFGNDAQLSDPSLLFSTAATATEGTEKKSLPVPPVPRTIIVSAQKVSQEFLQAWRQHADATLMAKDADADADAEAEGASSSTIALTLIRRGTSLDSIDRQAAEGYGIRVINTPGVNSPHVARFVTSFLDVKTLKGEAESGGDSRAAPKVVIFGAGSVGKDVVQHVRETCGLKPYIVTKSSLSFPLAAAPDVSGADEKQDANTELDAEGKGGEAEERERLGNERDAALHQRYGLPAGSAIFPTSIAEALSGASHVAVCCPPTHHLSEGGNPSPIFDVAAVDALMEDVTSTDNRSTNGPIRICCIARPEAFSAEAIVRLHSVATTSAGADKKRDVTLRFDYGPTVLKPMQDKLSSLLAPSESSSGLMKIEWSSQAMSSEACKTDMDTAVLKIISREFLEEILSDVTGHIDVVRPLIEVSPDAYTFWNHRRVLFSMQWQLQRLLLQLDSPSSAEKHKKQALQQQQQLHQMFIQDLIAEHAFNTVVLKKDYKSYFAWLHRRWIVDHLEYFDVTPSKKVFMKVMLGERAAVEKLLMADERNFHAWGYRRWVTGLLRRLGVYTDGDEKTFTEAKISSNFSNYSAWHNRAMMLQRDLSTEQQQQQQEEGKEEQEEGNKENAEKQPMQSSPTMAATTPCMLQNRVSALRSALRSYGSRSSDKHPSGADSHIAPSAGGINMGPVVGGATGAEEITANNTSNSNSNNKQKFRFLRNTILKEGSMIRRAMYCDPGDQSAWLYAEWFAVELCSSVLRTSKTTRDDTDTAGTEEQQQQQQQQLRLTEQIARRVLHGLISSASELAQDGCADTAQSLVYPLWFIGSVCEKVQKNQNENQSQSQQEQQSSCDSSNSKSNRIGPIIKHITTSSPAVIRHDGDEDASADIEEEEEEEEETDDEYAEYEEEFPAPEEEDDDDDEDTGEDSDSALQIPWPLVYQQQTFHAEEGEEEGNQHGGEQQQEHQDAETTKTSKSKKAMLSDYFFGLSDRDGDGDGDDDDDVETVPIKTLHDVWFLLSHIDPLRAGYYRWKMAMGGVDEKKKKKEISSHHQQ